MVGNDVEPCNARDGETPFFFLCFFVLSLFLFSRKAHPFQPNPFHSGPLVADLSGKLGGGGKSRISKIRPLGVHNEQYIIHTVPV